MKLPKSWTTVTPLSKTIALILAILMPLIGFYLGVYYKQQNRSIHDAYTYPQVRPMIQPYHVAQP